MEKQVSHIDYVCENATIKRKGGILMIDVGYNNGDIAVNQYGDIAICPSEDADVIQMANNHIRLRLGGNKYHPEIGNAIYGNRIKWNETGKDLVAEECRVAIMQDPRINDIVELNVEYGASHEAIIDYTVNYTPMDLDEYDDEEEYFSDDENPDTESDVNFDEDLDTDNDFDDNDFDEDEEDEVIERTVSSRISIDAFNTTEEVLV